MDWFLFSALLLCALKALSYSSPHSLIHTSTSMLFLCKYFVSKTHTLMQHRCGHQSITGFTHRDRQLFMVTHTTLKKKEACSNGNKVLLFHNILKTDTFSETFNIPYYKKPYSSNGALQRFSLN